MNAKKVNEFSKQPLQLVLRSSLIQSQPEPGMVSDMQSTAERAHMMAALLAGCGRSGGSGSAGTAAAQSANLDVDADSLHQCRGLHRQVYAQPVQGQHRIILVRGLRRQIFRQMKQKAQAILCVLPSIFVKYAGTICKQDVRRELCGVALGL